MQLPFRDSLHNTTGLLGLRVLHDSRTPFLVGAGDEVAATLSMTVELVIVRAPLGNAVKDFS